MHVGEDGQNRFVIAGIGFRSRSDEEDRFACLWRDCPQSRTSNGPASLAGHVQHHIDSHPTTCAWSTCQNTPFTASHLFTHLPTLKMPQIPETITAHPSDASSSIPQQITSRTVAPLPKTFRMGFMGQVTPTHLSPTTNARHPIGVAFLSALVIRNLARALKSELAAVRRDLDDEKAAKKRRLDEQRFGLPIPDKILKEEEEEEAKGEKASQSGMSEEAMMRAKSAFEGVEERIAEVVGVNVVGLGQYLGDAFGW